MADRTDPVVSFGNEPLILVDGEDRELGFDSKEACHEGRGKLHRAFSVFLFDAGGELLLQQRSNQKPLWPGFWTNSCCSHPRRGEEAMEAARRRVSEELGVNAELIFLFKFEYQAAFKDLGSEHELCSVYVGRIEGEPVVNRNEVDDWRFVSPAALDREMAEQPDQFTPWFKIEWPRIRDEFWPAVTGA